VLDECDFTFYTSTDVLYQAIWTMVGDMAFGFG
jgi:hypothetical protein